MCELRLPPPEAAGVDSLQERWRGSHVVNGTATERTYLEGGGLSRGTLLNSAMVDVDMTTEEEGVVVMAGLKALGITGDLLPSRLAGLAGGPGPMSGIDRIEKG